MITAQQWADDLLSHAAWPVARSAEQVLIAWALGEGTRARFNVLATTRRMPGSTDFNWNNGYPVQNYPDYPTGIEATHRAITNGLYPTIVAGFARGDGYAALNRPHEFDIWGTGGAHVLSLFHDVVARWPHDATWVPRALADAPSPVPSPVPLPAPTSTPIKEGPVLLTSLTILTDDAGNGWRDSGIPWSQFVAATKQGSSPPDDHGYWPGSAQAQNRNGQARVCVTGCDPARQVETVLVAHS